MKKIIVFALLLITSLVLVSCIGNGEDVKYYKVSYLTGDSSLVLPDERVEEGKLISRPRDLNREGFDFVHWVDATNDEEWIFETNVVKRDIELKAIWREITTIFDFEYANNFKLLDGNIMLEFNFYYNSEKVELTTIDSVTKKTELGEEIIDFTEGFFYNIDDKKEESFEIKHKDNMIYTATMNITEHLTDGVMNREDNNVYTIDNKNYEKYILNVDKTKVSFKDNKGVFAFKNNKFEKVININNDTRFLQDITEIDRIETLFVIDKDNNLILATYGYKQSKYFSIELGENLVSNIDKTDFVLENTKVEVTVSIPTGYEIVAFTVNGINLKDELVDNKYTFTISKDISINVTLKEEDKYYSLTLDEHITSDVENLNSILENTLIKISIFIPNGYKFDKLIVNDDDLSNQVTDNIFEFTIKSNTKIDLLLVFLLENTLFENKTEVYTGANIQIIVQGLPEGFYVEYDNNTHIDAGTYEATARIYNESNNEITLELNALLEITLKELDIKFDDMDIKFDGNEHSLEVITDFLPLDVTVVYITGDEGTNTRTHPGKYKVTAIILSNNDNYAYPKKLIAELAIYYEVIYIKNEEQIIKKNYSPWLADHQVDTNLEGYVFEGFYIDSNYENIVMSKHYLYGHTTIYIKYKKMEDK